MEDIYETTRPITARQKMAVDYWINGGRKSKADALRKAGYGRGIVCQPHRVFDSSAVKNELFLLGYGYDGKSLRSKPKAIVIEKPKNQGVSQSVFEELTRPNVIKELRDLLEKTPPRNPVVSMDENVYRGNSHIPVNDPNCDIFGERLSNEPEEDRPMKMNDFFSL